MNIKDAEKAKQIWEDVIGQIDKLPLETYAIVIKGLPPAIRKQLPGAHPTIRKALELLGEPTKGIGFNPEITPQTEMDIFFSYASETLIEAAWKQLRERNNQAVPDPPDIYQGKDKAPIPNNPYSHFVMQAVLKGGPLARFITDGWRDNQFNGQPHYTQKAGSWKGGSMRAHFEQEEQQAGLAQAQIAGELWGKVEKLSPFTADIALAALGALGDPRQGEKPKYPLMEPVLLTTGRILEYKGIQKWGSDRRVLEQRVEQEMNTLRALSVEVENVPHWDKKKPAITIKNCKLFDVVDVYRYQHELFDGGTLEIQVGWSVRAGQWAYYWFNEQGRVWLSNMSRALLELDHRGVRGADVMAKSLGVMLLAVPGGTAHMNAPITRRVERLLADIGMLPEPEHRKKNWANRTRGQFDTALELLKSMGVLADYTFNESYPDTGDRSRGWVERWLAATVTLTAPDITLLENDPARAERNTQNLKEYKRREKKTRNRGKAKPRKALEKGQALDDETVIRIRKTTAERNMLLKELAATLGIAKSTLSNVLNRREAPSTELAGKIRAFLDSPVEE